MTEHTASSRTGGFWDTIRTIGWAVLIAVGIRTIAVEPFNIPSGSMIPTLLVGDYLFVSKWSYGYSRHSMPFSPPLFSGRIAGSEPQRGDVAVFKLPVDNKTDYIKRVIGLPGERIQMRGGRLFINGREVPRERLREVSYTDGWQQVRAVEYRETLPGGRQHLIHEFRDSDPLDNTPEFVVPPGHYFMMGDNRDNSQDSRVLSLVGYVPFENFVGRAEILFFSTNGTAALWEIWGWPSAIRYDRLLQWVR
ncbi:MAG: signal peptidase I [Alphaproteobacteria bacterium]|nr:MAG: signal peptidase I [Alphaproteobacteria bacterium]